MTNRERAEAIAVQVCGYNATPELDPGEKLHLALTTQAIENFADAAVRDAVAEVQAQLDAERKAHAETRAQLREIAERAKPHVRMTRDNISGRDFKDYTDDLLTKIDAALAAPTRAKGDQ